MIRRYVSLVDIGIAVVALVAVFLPPREMYASHAVKGDAAKQFAIAHAEARVQAYPGDGHAVEDLARKLGEADMKDWAIETAVRASERAKEAPTRWRAMVAASVAYVDRLDVVPALDYANRALAACESAREKGDAAACPTFEEVKMRLYQQHLDAGVKSGIDPRQDPAGFRRAGESVLRPVRLGGGDRERESTPPPSGGAGANSPAPPPSPAP
jgi:hypothetical protein